MAYPIQMQDSLREVERTREVRLGQKIEKLGFREKEELLKGFHPDYLEGQKKQLRIGPNRGDFLPKELVDLLESPSRLNPEEVDPARPDYETEVLVVGGGGGAVTAALTAGEAGAEVLLATKLRLGDSNTIMAEGGIGAATQAEDSPAIHYVDTMVGGRFKNKSDLVEALVLEAPFIIDWLAGLGVNFDRREDGSFFTHMPGGHSRRRSHSVKDLTGLEIMRVLADELRNRKIPVLEFNPALEILLDGEGRCVGAVLKNLDTGRCSVVRARSTIIATGGLGRLHPQGFPTSNHYGATADGLVMAYRAGAGLLYMDYIQYHPTGMAWPEQMLGLLISEALRAQGAQVVNAGGDQFAHRLETRDALSAAIIRECTSGGRGVTTPTGMVGVWLDTPLIDMVCGEGTFLRRFAGINDRFQKYGIDPVREPILVFPTQHYQNGGVEIDRHGRTSIPNLYLAGEVAGGVHGHNRLGSNSLLDIFVFGRRAGRHAADPANLKPGGEATLDHLRAYHDELREKGIESGRTSPLLLPDYRFEKALTSLEHLDRS